MNTQNTWSSRWLNLPDSVLVAQSCPALCKPMDEGAHQAPSFMEFSRQEY